MVLEQIANLSVVNSACRFDFYTLRLQNERGVKVMKGVHAVDKDKFIEAYNKWASGEVTITKATEIAGMSYPTFHKYVGILITGGKFPDGLFKD